MSILFLSDDPLLCKVGRCCNDVVLYGVDGTNAILDVMVESSSVATVIVDDNFVMIVLLCIVMLYSMLLYMLLCCVLLFV